MAPPVDPQRPVRPARPRCSDGARGRVLRPTGEGICTPAGTFPGPGDRRHGFSRRGQDRQRNGSGSAGTDAEQPTERTTTRDGAHDSVPSVSGMQQTPALSNHPMWWSFRIRSIVTAIVGM